MPKAEGHSIIETPTYDVVIVLLTMVVFALVFERVSVLGRSGTKRFRCVWLLM
jgi:hypothetical protein